MDVTQLSGPEFLRRLGQFNANSATMPEGKRLLAAISKSSAENKERLVLELLGTAEEEVKLDVCLSESLAWAVGWCSSVRGEKRDRLRSGLTSILKTLSERLIRVDESKGEISGRNPPVVDFTIALVGLRKIDPELCKTKLKEFEELASRGRDQNLSVALKQFKTMESKADSQ